MSSTNSCNTIGANADVLGIGVRIEFYFTMILLAIVPRTPNTEELLSALYAAAGFSGLGLLLTAIIQTALNQLSIFEGLFVFHVLFFLSTGVAPSGKYEWSKSRIAMGIFIQFASVVAFTGWGLYFWTHVKDFGTQPGCNLNDQVKYVIMFKDVRATASWLRGLWITLTVLSAVGLIIGFAFTAVQLFAMRSEEEEEEYGEEHTNAIARNSTPTATPAIQAHAETEMPSRNLWEVEIYYFKISIPLFLSSIYATTMLELMVHRNAAHVNNNGTVTGPGIVQIDNSWQFGQILAVVMIIAILNEFVHFFFGHLARRRRDRRARARAEGQAQGAEAAEQAPPPRSNVTYRPRGPAESSSSHDNQISKISSEYELHHLDKGNAVEVSQTVVDPNSQLHDLPIGSLR